MSAPARARLFAALLVLLAAATGIVVAVVDTDNDGHPDRVTVTIPIDGADRDPDRDDVLTVPKADVDQAVDKLEERDSELASPLRERDDPSRTPAGQLEGPLAADEIPGCRNRLVGNFSSRNATRPRVIVWHQTVSRENGWRSQDALTARAATRSSGVSWAALVGRSSGRCTYTVPLAMKAWTQGNANPFSVGIEVEAYGDEPSYVTGPGRRKLISITRHIGKRYGIPMRRGRVVDCRPVRSGIVEHHDLGACGGGHVDVASSRWQRNPAAGEIPGWDIAPLIAEARTDGITATDRVTCRKLNWWRINRRPHGVPERNAIRRRTALARRGVTCRTSGPTRA